MREIEKPGVMTIRVLPNGTTQVAIDGSQIGTVMSLDLSVRADQGYPDIVVGIPDPESLCSEDLKAYVASIEGQLQGFAPWVRVVRK
jgi:hypothetical protein